MGDGEVMYVYVWGVVYVCLPTWRGKGPWMKWLVDLRRASDSSAAEGKQWQRFPLDCWFMVGHYSQLFFI